MISIASYFVFLQPLQFCRRRAQRGVDSSGHEYVFVLLDLFVYDCTPAPYSGGCVFVSLDLLITTAHHPLNQTGASSYCWICLFTTAHQPLILAVRLRVTGFVCLRLHITHLIRRVRLRIAGFALYDCTQPTYSDGFVFVLLD